VEKVHKLDGSALLKSPIVHTTRLIVELQVDWENFRMLLEGVKKTCIFFFTVLLTNICFLRGGQIISRCSRVFKAEKLLHEIDGILINVKPERKDLSL